MNGCAFYRFTGNPNITMALLDNSINCNKTETRACAVFFYCKEQIANIFSGFLAHPYARIPHQL